MSKPACEPCDKPDIVFVQYEARSFTFLVTSTAGIDFTTVTGAYVLVHRQAPGPCPPPAVVVQWTAAVVTPLNVGSCKVLVPLNGTTPGPQALTVAGETGRMRLYLSFETGPDIEVSKQVSYLVVEA